MSDLNNNNSHFAPTQYARVDLFQRPELHALLEEATQKHVVTIVAGPGYGKTIAVSSFLLNKKNETIWLTLTHLDDFDTRLWESLCNAFSLICNKPNDFLHNVRFPTTDFDFSNFTKIIKECFNSNKRYYFVLDDFHNITNPSILLFIEKFVLMDVPNLCTIIISRSKPMINPTYLLSRNLLFPINVEALRLTEKEMSCYFEKQNIFLMQQAKLEFYEYTRGWFFAIYLVCLALKKGVLYRTNPLNAVKLDMFSLLEQEEYLAFSDELKNLLLRLALITHPPLELTIQLAGERQELVKQLLDSNSFVNFDEFNNIVYIHNLYLDFLQKNHNTLSQEDKDEIYLVAAKWYQKNNYRIDAITYYEKIDRYDCIIDILLTFNKAYSAKTMDFLLGIIDRMPKQLLIEKPIIRFLYIKFLMNNYRMDEVQQRSLALLQELEALPKTPENIFVLGELYTHLGFQTWITSGLTKTYEYPEYFKKAYHYLPNGSTLIQKPYLCVGTYICNVSSPEAGEFDHYINAIKQMLPFCKKLLPNSFDGYLSATKAEIAYFRKDNEAAKKHIDQAIRSTHNGNCENMEITALALQTRIYVDSGNYTKTMDSLEQQKQFIKNTKSSKSYIIHDLSLGWFFAQLGLNHMVPHWIKAKQQSREVMTPITFGIDKLIRAKCLLNDNEIYQLLALLTAKSDEFSFEYYLFGLIEMKVMKAIAHNLIKEYKEAAKELQEAYELALPNKIIMPFIENGKYTRTLLSRTAPYIDIPSAWLDDIQTKSTTYAKRLSKFATIFNTTTNLKDNKPNLSHRETEILAALCQNLTRDEIATAYGLSVNTVRSIIINIHNKLGVTNNLDAVRVATQLKLI